MKFVRAVWKLLVGIKDALVLLLLLLFFGRSTRPVGHGRRAVGEGVLDLNLNGSVVEQPARRGWAEARAASSSATIACATSSLRSTRPRSDARVKAVALDLDGFTGGGQTAIDDLAEAVRRVRAVGQAGGGLWHGL